MKLTFHQYLQGQSFHIEQTHLAMPYSYAGEKCCYALRVCNGKYVFTYGAFFLYLVNSNDHFLDKSDKNLYFDSSI